MELTSGIPSKGSVVKRNQQPVTTEQNPSKENASKLTSENSEAVSQLLSAAPPKVSEENEWEEVIISDTHVLVKEAPEQRGTPVTKTPVVQSGVQPEVTVATSDSDGLGPDIPVLAEGTNTSTPLPVPKKPTG